MQVELLDSTVHLPLDQAPRSEGVHVSGAIRCIAAESKILDPKWVDDLSLVDASQAGWWESLSMDNKLRIAIGLAWEQWYAPTLEGVVFHPGEMELDGIYMTHDGESLDTVKHDRLTLCLHEFKSTYKSTKTVGALVDQWMWMMQMKCYCKGLGTRVGYLHALFLCGDYKYPITPQLKVWLIRFTQEEIDEAWELIVSYVKHRHYLDRELMEEAGLEGGV